MASTWMRLIKRGILVFWAAWLSLVCATNVLDGLKTLGALPASWSLTSGNYDLMQKVTARLDTPGWLVTFLFIGVMAWEGLAALLFWAAAWVFGSTGRGPAIVLAAFAVNLALWAAFMIADEIFIAYPLEGVHRGLFVACLASLLVVRLLPDE